MTIEVKLDPVIGCAVFFIEHLSQGRLLEVLFVPDAHKETVAPTFSGADAVLFQYGVGLPIPIPDLEITHDGIRATLSFDRVAKPTFVPWGAILLITTSVPTTKGEATVGVPGPLGVARGVVPESYDAKPVDAARAGTLRLVKGGQG